MVRVADPPAEAKAFAVSGSKSGIVARTNIRSRRHLSGVRVHHYYLLIVADRKRAAILLIDRQPGRSLARSKRPAMNDL
jgi:hypothetical protein